MISSEEEFKKAFTVENKKFILECLSKGLETYADPMLYGAEARRDHTPSVRAQIRSCHIIAHASRAAIGRPDIRVINKRGRVLFVFNDKYLVSIKKFDHHFRTASAPTQQALAFKGQQQLALELPPQLVNIFAGYRYDVTETQFEVYITCPNGEQYQWVWKISGAEMQDFLANPVTKSDDIGTIHRVQKRVRIRPDVQRKENNA